MRLFCDLRSVQEMETTEKKGRRREREGVESTSHFEAKLQSTSFTSLESCEPRATDNLTDGGPERKERNGQVCFWRFRLY